jgi:DNA polymerase
VIEKGSAVYTDMATKVFGRPVKKQEIAEYTIGKNVVLGCGFQMGWRKFQSRYAKDHPDDFCKAAVTEYRENFAPEVPSLWGGLEEAAIRAVWDRRPCEAYGVLYAWEDQWLTARLPSGRKLYYFNPQKCRKAMPWDPSDIRPAWTCQAQKQGRWITRDMYGGLLTENVVQGLARDLMVRAMFLCEKENLPIILTVHDEIVAEPLTGNSDADKLRQIMADRPKWAIDMQIPVAAETWAGPRYAKK